MSSYAEMSFFKTKTTKYGQKNFWGEIGRYGVQKIRNFTLISKWGILSLCSVQKLEPKNLIFRDFPNPKKSKNRLPLLCNNACLKSE
jgi:hypothetical protein